MRLNFISITFFVFSVFSSGGVRANNVSAFVAPTENFTCNLSAPTPLALMKDFYKNLGEAAMSVAPDDAASTPTASLLKANWLAAVPIMGCLIIKEGIDRQADLFALSPLIYSLLSLSFGLFIYNFLLKKDYQYAFGYLVTLFMLVIFIRFDIRMLAQLTTNILFWAFNNYWTSVGEFVFYYIVLGSGFLLTGIASSFGGSIPIVGSGVAVLSSLILDVGLVILGLVILFVWNLAGTIFRIFLSAALLVFAGHFILVLSAFPFTRYLMIGFLKGLGHTSIEMIFILVALSLTTFVSIETIKAFAGEYFTPGTDLVALLIKFLSPSVSTALLVYFLFLWVMLLALCMAFVMSGVSVAKSAASMVTGGQGTTESASRPTRGLSKVLGEFGEKTSGISSKVSGKVVASIANRFKK